MSNLAKLSQAGLFEITIKRYQENEVLALGDRTARSWGVTCLRLGYRHPLVCSRPWTSSRVVGKIAVHAIAKQFFSWGGLCRAPGRAPLIGSFETFSFLDKAV